MSHQITSPVHQQFGHAAPPPPLGVTRRKFFVNINCLRRQTDSWQTSRKILLNIRISEINLEKMFGRNKESISILSCEERQKHLPFIEGKTRNSFLS